SRTSRTDLSVGSVGAFVRFVRFVVMSLTACGGRGCQRTQNEGRPGHEGALRARPISRGSTIIPRAKRAPRVLSALFAVCFWFSRVPAFAAMSRVRVSVGQRAGGEGGLEFG